MPRPARLPEQRKDFLPIVAKTFAELGYRRTTTAKLGSRCGVRENILFRLWPSKKAMFLASIEYVYELSEGIWTELLLKNGGGEESAEKLLKYESMHHGEFGMYRILFAGLTEADDPEIRASLAQTYRRFHKFIRQQISTHHKNQAEKSTRDIEFLAWAYLGLGTVANIAKELDLIPARQRRQLIHTVGLLLLKGTSL